MIQSISDFNSADTIKLGFDLDILNPNIDLIKSRSIESIHHKSNGIKTYLNHTDMHGFNFIQVSPDTNRATLQLSAKILGIDYRNGINSTNIQQVTDKLNESNLIKLNPDTFLNGDLYRYDANRTIELSHSPDKAVKAIKILSSKGYDFKRHPTGIDVRHQAKTRKERLVFYGKRDELLLSANKDFLKDYPKVLDTFTDNSLRIESGFTNHKLIRKVFEIEKKDKGIKLAEILNSKINSLQFMFKEISKDYNSIINTISMAENMKTIQELIFIEKCNYDIDLIMAIVDSTTKGRTNRYKAKYLDLIAKAKANEAIEHGYNSVINDIELKLSIAV